MIDSLKKLQAVLFDFWGVIYNPQTNCPNNGLEQYMQYLQKNKIYCGIASSSNKTTITNFLLQNNLISYFQAIVAIEDVINTKPHPECYLSLAKQFNVDILHCLIIDDNTTTVEQTHKIGFVTILFGQKGMNFANMMSTTK